MAHSIDIKEKAFQLYCQGLSIDKIAQEVKVNRKTILRKGTGWKDSMGWDVRRDAIRQIVQSKTDQKQIDLLTRLHDKTLALWTEVTDELNQTQFKSKEGAIASYQSLTNMMLKFMPQKQGLKDEALKKIFAILFSHPKVGPVIERYKDELLEAIDKELKKL
jgi:transposase